MRWIIWYPLQSHGLSQLDFREEPAENFLKSKIIRSTSQMEKITFHPTKSDQIYFLLGTAIKALNHN